MRTVSTTSPLDTHHHLETTIRLYLGTSWSSTSYRSLMTSHIHWFTHKQHAYKTNMSTDSTHTDTCTLTDRQTDRQTDRHTHTHTHTDTCTFTHTHTGTQAHTHTCTHSHGHTHILHTHTHMDTHTHTDIAHTHTRTHTPIHTHPQTEQGHHKEKGKPRNQPLTVVPQDVEPGAVVHADTHVVRTDAQKGGFHLNGYSHRLLLQCTITVTCTLYLCVSETAGMEWWEEGMGGGG